MRDHGNVAQKREGFENDLMTLDEEEKDLPDQNKDADNRLQIYSDYLAMEFSEGEHQFDTK